MAWTSRVAILACALIVILCMYGAYEMNGESLDFSDSEVVLVNTNSMDGDVHEYDVGSFPAESMVMIKNIPSHEVHFIRTGQVIAYNVGDELSVLRVIGVDINNQSITVSGDNSDIVKTVAYSQVVGIVAGSNQYLGKVVSFVEGNPLLVLAIVGFVVAGVVLYRFRDSIPKMEINGMRKGVAYTITFVAIVGIAAAGVGYAYTSSTMNSSNNAASEYVVLTQNEYTFTSEPYSLNYSTVAKADGKYYQLTNVEQDCLMVIGEAPNDLHYYGVVIGKDVLTSALVGFSAETIPLKLQTTNDGFTNFEGTGWMYVMKLVPRTAGDTLVAYWDGDTENRYWSCVGGSYLPLMAGVTYDTTLYFAAPGIDVNRSSYDAKFGDEITVISDVTLKALWLEDGKGHTVSFSAGTGSGSKGSVSNVSGTYVLPDSTGLTPPTGDVFDHWSVRIGNSTNLDRYPGEKIDVVADTILTAVWGAQGTHTISFDGNGGTGSMSPVANVPGKYILPENGFTAPAGKVFKGWLIPAGESKYTRGVPGERISVESNVQLKAEWQDILDTFTVTFDGNGGTGPMDPVSGVSGLYELPASTFTPPEDTTFNGWEVMPKLWVGQVKGAVPVYAGSEPERTATEIVKNGTIKFISNSEWN